MTLSVVVVGSGAAGMSAAVAAATSGADVTILEAADHIGGTTAISGGGLWMPANPWAAANGIEDTVEAGVTYLKALQAGGGDALPAAAEAYVNEGLRITRTIEERTPIRWEHIRGFADYHTNLPGGVEDGRSLEMKPFQASPEAHALVRENPYRMPPMTIAEEELPTPPDAEELARREAERVMARGCGLIAAFTDAALANNVSIRTSTRATTLRIEKGIVTGVEAAGETFEGDVILASGGFERNESLLASYLPGPFLGPAGPPTNRGDGLVMAQQAGARLANMSDAWWVATLHVPGETIDGAPFNRMLFIDASRPGAIAVDQNGRRFVNESVNYYAFGRELSQRDPNTFAYLRAPSYIVMDSRRRRILPFAWIQPGRPDPDWLPKAGSIRELADLIGVPADALEETVEHFNAMAAAGKDTDFARGETGYDVFANMGAALVPVSEPPFYALRMQPGGHGTKGGPAIDERARVLSRSGDPIPGLFAAGNASAHPFRRGFAGPGAPIGAGVVFGWLAGETAAAG